MARREGGPCPERLPLVRFVSLKHGRYHSATDPWAAPLGAPCAPSRSRARALAAALTVSPEVARTRSHREPHCCRSVSSCVICGWADVGNGEIKSHI